jgi:protein O-GlcNAc transferase
MSAKKNPARRKKPKKAKTARKPAGGRAAPRARKPTQPIKESAPAPAAPREPGLPALQELLTEAVACHKRGDLQGAERGYRAVLAKSPDHFDALHMLGAARGQAGHHAEAVELISRAIGIKPDSAEAQNNLGYALQALKRHGEAVECFRRAAALKPAYFDAHRNLGQMLLALKQPGDAIASFEKALAIRPAAGLYCSLGNAFVASGRAAAAVDAYRKALAIHPGYAAAHQPLAGALMSLQRPAEALDAVDKLLALKPGNAEVLCQRGAALAAMGRTADSADAYRRAIATRPDLLRAHFGLGNALASLGRIEEAIETFRAVLAGRPEVDAAHYNLGSMLANAGRTEEGIASLRQALALNPRHVKAHNNLGNALLSLNRAREACASFNRAVAVAPGYAEAHNNRGIALVALGRKDEAIEAYRKALEIRPEFVEAHNNLAHVLRMADRRAEALASYEKVLALNPGHAYAPGMLVSTAAAICEWRGRAERIQRLVDGMRAGEPVATPFALLGISGDPADQLACASAYARRRFPAAPAPLWRGERYRHERIRVAYLSADFRDHPVAWLIAELIERHDRHRFETIGVSFGPEAPSAMRERLEGAFERFVDVRAKSDAEIAAWLRESEVDIAVDLVGHTLEARTGIFARRPAPVQVNYLGFPGTMGAGYYDYIIADAFVVPEGAQGSYSEKIARLPDTFQANGAGKTMAAHAPARDRAGLPERGFVYCCFNNSYKITPETFDVWMRVLKAVDGSVLWLATGDGTARANLAREAQARGVAPERLVFTPRVKQEDYLARYRLADLFLDTLPFNAGTTASDALWAGLPVLTCAGATFTGRMAGSLLNAIGLPELVTHRLEDYEALAIELATRPEPLRAIKGKLAANRLTAPLFDVERFRRHIEAAYRTMWEITQRGEPARSFAVAPVESGHEGVSSVR